MKTTSTLASIAFIAAATLPASLRAQAIGGASRQWEENVGDTWISAERDTVVTYKHRPVQATVFNERIEGNGKAAYRVILVRGYDNGSAPVRRMPDDERFHVADMLSELYADVRFADKTKS